MSASSADCVIVGGGIGGAVLALLLGRQGRHVVLLERELQPPAIGRPEVLARSTVEVFHRLGVGTRILQEAAIPLQGLELWQAGGTRILRLSREDFDRAGAQPYSTDPARTRRILLEAAEATQSVEVRRGVEVRELVRDGSSVEVRAVRGDEPLTWQARLVVGDDGGHSRVRQALNIPLTLHEFPLEFLCAAGPALPGHKDGVGQAWVDPRAVRDGLAGGVFMPLPGQRTAFVFLLSSKAHQRFANGSPADFYDAAARFSPRCARLAEQYTFPDAFASLRRPFGHAPRYVGEGAALMGDAAHPVTPAGGQGANMSVADAVALADVALNALRSGDCSAAQLAAYESLRRPANQRSLQFSARTARALKVLRLLPGLAPLLPWLLTRVERSLRTKQRFIRAISHAFLSSRSGPSS